MTSDMQIFKVKKNNGKSNIMLPLLLSFCLMFAIWSNVNILFEKISPMHLQFIILSMSVLLASIMTIIEGIYKSGPLIFNCKDDQLLLSLPIKRETVLFIRIFKFYIFELLYNSLFIIPIILAYVRWADFIDWTFFLTSIVMILMLPIIPIVISCILGAISSSISSRFKYKNIMQIVTSMTLLLIIFYISFSIDNIFDYLIKNATSINDLITKLYYPAGVFASLSIKFNIIDLLIFITVNITIFIIAIYILSKFYFKINSRLKKITTTNKTKVDALIIKSNSVNKSLIKKELNTFFQTPVFIINAGFGLVLFILAAIIISLKFDSIVPTLTEPNGIGYSKKIIMNNLSILIFMLISFTAYMTSITNSVISLEGKNINILKSLPIKTKTILMSKIYASLIITTPILLIGDLILFIRFKINIVESILLILLSILIPLVSHFIGLIINLKYPKLDAENTTEIVKQSTSSLLSVMIGVVLLMITFIIITNIIGLINSSIILIIFTIIYLIIDALLYLYLINKGVKEFNNL